MSILSNKYSLPLFKEKTISPTFCKKCLGDRITSLVQKNSK